MIEDFTVTNIQGIDYYIESKAAPVWIWKKDEEGMWIIIDKKEAKRIVKTIRIRKYKLV